MGVPNPNRAATQFLVFGTQGRDTHLALSLRNGPNPVKDKYRTICGVVFYRKTTLYRRYKWQRLRRSEEEAAWTLVNCSRCVALHRAALERVAMRLHPLRKDTP